VLGIEMKNLNKNKKKNNTIVSTAMLLSLATIIVITGVTTTPLTALGSRSGGGEALEGEK
jgi:hypothetical protein